MGRTFRSRVNQTGRALSFDDYRSAEVPPEQIAARLRESEADRLAIADSLNTVDRDLSALEVSRVITASIYIRISEGVVEIRTKNIGADATVSSGGALIVRLGRAIEGEYAIHPFTQREGPPEFYWPVFIEPDHFVLQCHDASNTPTDLNVGFHAVSILIQS